MSNQAKPQDVNSILITAQDTIDAALQTIRETQHTQEILHENIIATDYRIDKHNKSDESHEDIRLQLKDMPAMISQPIITGVDSIETGTESTWTFSATGAFPTINVTKYLVIAPDGQYEVPVNEGGTGIFTHTFVGERNSTLIFTVQAFGGTDNGAASYKSEVTSYSLLITHHLPPNLDNISVQYPEKISAGFTYDFVVSNISDPDDDFTDYSIICSDLKLTFSSKDKLHNDDVVHITVASDYNGPAIIPVVIEAHDDWGLSNSRQIDLTLNAWPVANAWGHTFPVYLSANASIPVRVFGVTDVDGDSSDISFSVVSSEPSITFSKSTDIKLNEDFHVNIGEVAYHTPYTLTFTFTDKYGATATNFISSTINQPPIMTAFQCTQNALHVPNQSSNISFSGVTDAEGESVTYSISNTNQALSFSKTVGILEGEQVVCSVNTLAISGATYNITVLAIDKSGGTSQVVVPIKINIAPTSDVFQTEILSRVKPSTSYSWKFITNTDPDGQQLHYTVTSEQEGVTITNGNNITAGTAFTCTTPSETQVARGSYFILKVTATDGLETIVNDYIVYMNQLPVANGISTNIPSTMHGGTNNKISFMIAGGSDAEHDALTYSIENASVGLTFSKTVGIVANESITLSVSKVTVDTPASFDIRVTDAFGESSLDVVTVNFVILPIYITAQPNITSPVNGAEVAYEGFDVIWTDATIDVDTSLT